MNKSTLAAPSKPQLLGFLLMLVLLAVGLGYGYYHKQRYLAVTRAQNELAAIANLKVSQILTGSKNANPRATPLLEIP
jgi:hypothetical protein